MDDHPTTRRERRKHEVRSRIMEAALQLLEQQGLEATTVDQIAEAADISRGTFFNHFPTKESLLSAIALDELEGLAAQKPAAQKPAAQKPAASTSALDRIYGLMRGLMADSLAYRQVTRHVLLDALSHTEEAGSPGAALEGMLRELVAQAQGEGSLRADVDPATIAVALIGVYLGAFARLPAPAPAGASADPAASAQALVDAYAVLLFEGIAGPAERAQ